MSDKRGADGADGEEREPRDATPDDVDEVDDVEAAPRQPASAAAQRRSQQRRSQEGRSASARARPNAGGTQGRQSQRTDRPKSSVARQEATGLGRITRFVREVVAELGKVIWPTRKQHLTYFIVVLVFVTFMVSLVAGLDMLFARAVFSVFG